MCDTIGIWGGGGDREGEIDHVVTINLETSTPDRVDSECLVS